MKKILEIILRQISIRILRKYKPQIVGITGSVGKTSAKEAVYGVLAGKYRAKRNIKNYNNEIGLPLTIIGVESPGRSILGWLGVLVAGCRLLCGRRDYPDMLVLEMGIDRPGDMDYFLTFIRPNVGIMTLVGQSHIEYFESVEHIQKEKGKLLKILAEDGYAIANFDNQLAKEAAEASPAHVLGFAIDGQADVRAESLEYCLSEDISRAGIRLNITYQDKIAPVFLPGVLGRPAVYAALAGAAAGLSYGLSLTEIAESLRRLDHPAGRMRLLSGLSSSVIIDDTYNSSPQSATAALEALAAISSSRGRKIAVLGDMLELGKDADCSHAKIGSLVASLSLDILLAVGPLSEITAKAAEAGLGQDRVKCFAGPVEAAEYLQQELRSGDLVLVKGSQGMRMEKVVKAMLAEQDMAAGLLVRQDGAWLKS
jgi:UDP-N-acetylmuramoyl-tripeptide--D-alanyl-D-alanine ligase